MRVYADNAHGVLVLFLRYQMVLVCQTNGNVCNTMVVFEVMLYLYVHVYQMVPWCHWYQGTRYVPPASMCGRVPLVSNGMPRTHRIVVAGALRVRQTFGAGVPVVAESLR